MGGWYRLFCLTSLPVPPRPQGLLSSCLHPSCPSQIPLLGSVVQQNIPQAERNRARWLCHTPPRSAFGRLCKEQDPLLGSRRPSWLGAWQAPLLGSCMPEALSSDEAFAGTAAWLVTRLH